MSGAKINNNATYDFMKPLIKSTKISKKVNEKSKEKQSIILKSAFSSVSSVKIQVK